MKHSVSGLILTVALLWPAAATAQEEVTLSIRGVIERRAHLYQTPGPIGVVLAHQSGYDAESWTALANRLKEAGATSIALESVSSEDVSAGIDFLRQLGKQRIVLIGASIGGAAAQRAAFDKGEAQAELVILLGTAEGDMSDVANVDKVFIVSEQDFFRARTQSSFRKAADPKELVILPGSAHGQDMFDEPFGEQLTTLILSRIARQNARNATPR
jgi:pimeloyl-ACP methyl ester carboxylesterase